MWFNYKVFQVAANLQNFFKYISWKKSTYNWSYTVQTPVVQGSTVDNFNIHIFQKIGSPKSLFQQLYVDMNRAFWKFAYMRERENEGIYYYAFP